MKRQVKYRVLTLPGKVTLDIKASVDTDNPRSSDGEFTSTMDGGVYTTISMFPIITISITRQSELDENGVRQRTPWNPNDNLGMTRYQLPVFVGELEHIVEAMKQPKLYTYVSKRLTLNDALADQVKRIFQIGNMAVEMLPVVINQPDDSKVEGIQLKFNNEQSTVPLTLNEMETLLFTLKTFNLDSVLISMHMFYLKNPGGPSMINASGIPSI